MKKLIFLVALVFAISNVASAAIITSVERAGGASDDRAPIGVYDGDDAPLPSEAGGLADGVGVFSDREYPYINTPVELVGAEYIRTFNNDKNSSSTVTYTVTTSSPSIYAIGIDDRWNNQQERIDQVTALVGVTFADSGLNVYIQEKAPGVQDRPLSIFTAELPAGTHIFKGAGIDGNNFMVMGAMVPEPATLALLGFGGLAMLRRKR